VKNVKTRRLHWRIDDFGIPVFCSCFVDMLSIPTDLGSHVLLDTCKIAIHITYTNSSLLFWSQENVIQKGGYCHDSPSCPFPSGVRVLNAPLRTTSSTILLARSTKMLWSPGSLSRPKHRIQTVKCATLRI